MRKDAVEKDAGEGRPEKDAVEKEAFNLA